jgi:hypothetical protein
MKPKLKGKFTPLSNTNIGVVAILDKAAREMNLHI